MGYAAEHDMAHFGDLGGQGGVEDWVVVAMHSAPPAAHAVDELSAIFKIYVASFSVRYAVARKRVYGRGVWMPKMVEVEIVVYHGSELFRLPFGFSVTATVAE